MNKFSAFFLTATSLLLSACVSQKDADAKMVKGCAAVIDSVNAPHTVKSVTSSYAVDETVLGDTYRRVTLSYKEGGEAIEMDRQASCLFSQEWGPAKTRHMAVFQRMEADDIVVGRTEDGDTKGGLDRYSELVGVADAAMGQ